MNAVIRFHKGLLRLPLWVQLFMLALVAVNMVTPLFMIRRIEAQIVLGTFLASFTLMMILTRLVGFTRLLGLAHIFWIPLLLYVGSRLEVFDLRDLVERALKHNPFRRVWCISSG